MGILGGVFVLKSDLRVLIWAPQVPFLVPPKYPKKNHLDPLGTILDPGKVIFGHFIAFGHFPIEIPIEAKKSTHMGRKGRRGKT